jgi:hypothetical protein
MKLRGLPHSEIPGYASTRLTEAYRSVATSFFLCPSLPLRVGRSNLEEYFTLICIQRLLQPNAEIQVFDEDIGELLLALLARTKRTILARLERPDIYDLAVKELAIGLGDSQISSFLGLVMHEAVALGLPGLVNSNLARKDVAEDREGVIKGLVVDGLVEVLDEDVPNTGLAKGGVAVAPHDAARAALDARIVHRIEGTLRVDGVVEVNVRVTQRAASYGVAAHAQRRNRTDGLEDFEEHSFGDFGVQVADVKRCRGISSCCHDEDAIRRGERFFEVFVIFLVFSMF